MSGDQNALRVLIVGDSGVGKSSFAHVFAHLEPLKSPNCTVGCQIEIKVHTYNNAEYDVELWDVGGAPGHRRGRTMFYHNVHGIILVHDLTNRKSYNNLDKWANEVLNALSGRDQETGANGRSKPARDDADGLDIEDFVGDPSSVPMIIVGTKSDVPVSSTSKRALGGTYGESINVSCLSRNDFTPDSPAGRQLYAFLDRVAARRRGVASRTFPYASAGLYPGGTPVGLGDNTRLMSPYNTPPSFGPNYAAKDELARK